MNDGLAKYRDTATGISWSYDQKTVLHLCAALKASGIEARIKPLPFQRRGGSDEPNSLFVIQVKVPDRDRAREFVRGWRAAMRIRDDANSFAEGVVYAVYQRAGVVHPKLRAAVLELPASLESSKKGASK